MQTLTLENYHIKIGPCAESLAAHIEALAPSKIFVLVDHKTEKHCLSKLEDAKVPYHEKIVIPEGEVHKNLDTCQKIWQRLFDLKADRKSLVLNLGGGVICDMGGFSACTYMRGIPFIQIPTTLLSQVDASIGGKLGIDFYGLKNSVGLFRDPSAVYVDPSFLETLPLRELRSGYAEVIKHGLIRDRELWDTIVSAEPWDTLPWEEVITKSLIVKQVVVQEDPLERGLRKILNYGHTIGHAIESVMIDVGTPILHGEAIAAGMIAEGYLSHRLGSLTNDDLEKIGQYLLKIYGKLDLESITHASLMQKMKLDKKNVSAQINFTFIDGIGSSSIDHVASEKLIAESINYYSHL